MAQQIKKKFIADDAIDGSKLKLLEGEAVRLQTPAGEVELLKKDAQGKLVSEGDELSFKGDIEAHVESVRSVLQGNIDAEESARIADVNSEESRAMSVEGSLQSQLTQEISDRIADVNAEQSRAEGVEGSLQSQISQEVSDRQSEVTRVEGLLSTEESARIAGDLDLQNQINNVLSNIDPAALDSLTEIVSAFQSADSSLQGAISTLAGNSSGNIEAEESRAMAVEASLQTQITQEISDRIADVDEEMSRAMGVESSLQSQLNQEISDRIADVNSEESRAMGVEGSLQSGLNSEISTRAAADLTFLKLDGSRSMTAALSMGGQSVLTPVYKATQTVSAPSFQTTNFTYTQEALTSGFNASNEEVIISAMVMMPPMGGFGMPMPMVTEVAKFQNGAWSITRSDLIEQLTVPNSSCSFSFYYKGYEGTVQIQVIEKVSSLTSFKITNVANGTSSKDAVNFGQLDSLQSEVNTTQTGAGLSSSGSYVVDGTRHFSSNASSLHDADKKLDTALKSEESSRIAADSSLQSQLTQEISDRQADVDAEQSRAEGVESSLQSQITQEISDRIADVNAEESRAMGVESSLQSQISQEISDRIAAVSAEESARIAEDLTFFKKDGSREMTGSIIPSVTLSFDIGSPTKRFKDIYLSGNTIDLGGVTLSNESNEFIVRDSLNSELAIVSDNVREGSVNKFFLESRVQETEMSMLDVTKSGEVVSTDSLVDAVSKLQNQMTQEISDRQADVNTEQSRAEGVEASLQSQITQEISDRQADVNAEQSRAEAAEASLQSQIDNVLSNIDPAALDSLTEIVAAFQSADSSLQGTLDTLAQNSSSNIEAEESRAMAVEASLQSQITQEISDRIADVNAEESRAMGVEGSLQSQLTQEISDRIAGDISLQTEIDSLDGYALDLRSDLDDEISDRIADVNAEESRAMAVESSLQSQITQEISDRQADVNAEESRALAAEGLLDGRLDVLEALAFEKESFTLGVNPTGVTLAHSPKAKSTVMFVGRLALHEGLDYSISGNQVTFIGDFAYNSNDEIAAAEGDVVKVTYYY